MEAKLPVIRREQTNLAMPTTVDTLLRDLSDDDRSVWEAAEDSLVALGVQAVDSLLPYVAEDGLEHPGSRRHLRDIGLPAWWACHGGEFQACSADAMQPPADGVLPEDGLPSGVAVTDLITFGTSSYGELYLHRHEGSVHIWSRLDGPAKETLVPLSPNLDIFTRVLEAIHSYSNACWHPYPVEGDQEDVAQLFLDEMDEPAPGVFDPQTPSGTVWSWLYAGITELGVDGF